MIPIKLSLEGLYSYQQPQSIDFQKLTQAELFGIFGATGSGKSSILEAISFALYGKTERLSSREPGGTAYHMMNLKSDRLRIDFEFSAGPQEEERFRFVVENKRNRHDFEKTSSFQRRSYQWGNGDWRPLTHSDASQIIGLNYDHFKRSIIIPQGKFEEFIQLQSTERSKMLQDIFHLEKFELSGRVKSLQARNREALSALEAQLGQYAHISPDTLRENQEEKARLEESRKACEEKLASLQDQKRHLEQLRALFQQVEAKSIELKRLEEQAPEYEQRQHRLDRYIKGKDEFGIDLNEKNRLNRQVKELELRLEEKQKTQQQLQQELHRSQKLFQEVDQNYQSRDQLRRQIEELEQLQSLRVIWEKVEDREKRIGKGATKVQDSENKVRGFELSLTQVEDSIDALEKKRPDLDELLELEKWYAEHRRLRQALANVQQQQQKLTEQADRGRDQKRILARQVGLDLSEYELTTAKILAQVSSQRQEALDQKKKLEHEIHSAQVQATLHQMSKDLHLGEPCPLCGSTEHPSPYSLPPSDVALNRAQASLATLEQKLELFHQIIPKLETLLEQAKELQAEIQSINSQAQSAQQDLDLHAARFVWPDFAEEGEAKVEQRRLLAGQIKEEVNQARQQQKDLRAHIRNEQEQLSQWRPALSQLEAELNGFRGEFDSGLRSLRHIDYEKHREQSTEEIQASIHARQRDLKGLEELHQKLLGEMDQRKQKLATLEGELTTLRKDRQGSSADIAALNQKLERKLPGSGFDSVQSVIETLEWALNIDEEKQSLREFTRLITETRTSVRDLQSQISGQSFEPEVLRQLENNISELEQEQATLTQQIGGKIERAQQLQKDLAHKTELGKTLEKASLRADNLKTMEGLFRANGFVNYISTAYLENLCAAANQRFLSLNNNSLSLEVDQDNNFHVRDLLNGGKRRSIKTLSGGQTFQAALCLALALSDQVQQQVQAEQNFFFLDEGFGSQDKHSLQVIFKTLKALKKEKRIVGVISHVEELQQEIDTYLFIQNDQEKGSLVLPSWQ